jgi:hypothetical protein
MIRIQAAEIDDPELTPELLEDLRQEIAKEGFDAEVTDPHESRPARLREGIGLPDIDTLIVVARDASAVAGAARAAIAIARWARRHGPFAKREEAEPVAVIFLPDDEIVIVLNNPENEETGET